MYVIEKNIPTPNPTRNGIAFYKYPFFTMNVGDSFAVPVDPTTTLNYSRVANRVAIAIYNQKKRSNNNNMKFCYRTDKVNRVIRVWRTA
jgi:hypothetical protein